MSQEYFSVLCKLDPHELLQALFSAFIGIFICIYTSMIVNVILVEISLNIIFAFYFGIGFLLIGIMIMLRVQSSENNNFAINKGQPFLFLFSCLVILSGIFCFFLEENWFIKLPPIEKAPIYIIIAMSLNFCMIFIVVDFLNFLIGFCQKSHQKTMVETPKQVKHVIIVLLLSVLIGLLYGIIFSILDLEDKRGYQINPKLIQDEYYCLPISITLGFLGGFINEILRIRGDYLPILFEKQEDPFNEEI